MNHLCARGIFRTVLWGLFGICLWGGCLPPGWAAEPDCVRPYVVGASAMGSNMVITPDNQVQGTYAQVLAQIERTSACRFVYEIAPRARILTYLKRGYVVDLLVPIIRTKERDEVAEFVPLLKSHVMLVYHQRVSGDALAALKAGTIKVNVVRGFDYGPEYQALLEWLRAKNQLEEVNDPATIVRKILAGRADATLMVPQNMTAEAAELGLEKQLRSVALAEIPPNYSGVYLSRLRLSAEERSALRNQFQRLLKSGEFWKIFTAHTPAWAEAANQPVVVAP